MATRYRTRKQKRDPQEIVGTLNGQPITLAEWQALVKQQTQDMERSTCYGDDDCHSDADSGL